MCSVTGAFASGVAFTLVNGIGNTAQPASFDNCLNTGVIFAAFQGIFYKIGEAFGGGSAASADTDYARVKFMLESLGLEKYEKNMKKALLDDTCIMLLNDSALQEARIPPGPRLKILSNVDFYRRTASRDPAMALKSAYPIKPVEPKPLKN